MVDALPAGTRVDVGLRPEDIDIVEDGLPFSVDFVEELGATQLFHGRLGDESLVVQSPTGDVYAGSQTLKLTVSPAKVHLFDVDTGQRL